MKKYITIITFLMASLLGPQSLFAQEGGGDTSALQDSLTDVYIVTGTTLFGAIMGLSTLSFVDEPSEHLDNIVTGGAIGIIIGVGIVAMNQATKSKDMYLEGAGEVGLLDLSTSERIAAHRTQKKSYTEKPKDALQFFNYKFTF